MLPSEFLFLFFCLLSTKSKINRQEFERDRINRSGCFAFVYLGEHPQTPFPPSAPSGGTPSFPIVATGCQGREQVGRARLLRIYYLGETPRPPLPTLDTLRMKKIAGASSGQLFS